MVAWIEPLSLQTILINVFSGNPEIFLSIALIALSAMAAYFRMTTTTMFFMLGLFVMILSDTMPSPMFAFFSIFAGLIVGYIVSNIMHR